MNRFIILVLCWIFTSSCTATMLSRPGSRTLSKYGPVDQKSYSNRGSVSYLNQGADFVIKSRREDAYMQMYTACDGRYRIINERNDSRGSSIYSTPVGSSVWTIAGDIVHRVIDYECVEHPNAVKHRENHRKKTYHKMTSEECSNSDIKNYLHVASTSRNLNHIKDMYSRACRCKSPRGCLGAGEILQQMNDISASQWYFSKACKLGSNTACGQLIVRDN